jgi:sulfur-oxidizing protein SoxZ
MANPITSRITVPETARKGEVVDIQVLVRHPMERAIDAAGLTPMPRRILHTFRVRYAGAEIFRMDLSSGISPNPYIAFTTVAVETGDISFAWEEDGGALYTRTVRLTVA